MHDIAKAILLLLKARSFSTIKNLLAYRLHKTGKYYTLALNVQGATKTITLRTGTNDLGIATDILFKGEYRTPSGIAPKIIWDVGAHIGSASIYFSARYPNATIYAFEPFPENFYLLERNSKQSPMIRPIPTGLGKRKQKARYALSKDPRNYGAGTFKTTGSNTEKSVELTLTKPREIIRKNHIERIDLIKIDAEGSEYDILTSIPKKHLSACKVIIGELHGIKDYETLAYLSPWFNIGVRKKPAQRYFKFIAVNKNR